MKSKIHELLKRTNMRVSKKVFILTAIIAASLITTNGYSQVVVGARVGFGHVRVGFPVIAPRPVFVAPRPVFVAPRPVFVAPAPVVVAAPAPVVIDPVICADFPGYAYYDYPAWNGHFRDRVYFEHYRPFFVHAHPAFRAAYRGRI